MSSWDEPCGLVHKEIGYMSGAISIDNIVGGLTDGLKAYVRNGSKEENQGANAIFVRFMDKDTHSKEEALRHNGQAWADAFETAEEWFKNKDDFAEGIKNSYLSRHDWLRGKIQEYVEIGKRRDSTKIIIAQRISSVIDADTIIVMNEGKITGVGTHDELLKNNTEYQEIYYSQNEKEGGKNGTNA